MSVRALFDKLNGLSKKDNVLGFNGQLIDCVCLFFAKRLINLIKSEVECKMLFIIDF